MHHLFTRIAVIWALALATGYIGTPYFYLLFLSEDERKPIAARAPLIAADEVAVEVFERASPAVVFIFSQMDRIDEAGGSGSGFLWDRAGHVVTNNHVIRGARRIGVRFGAGDVIPAKVVGVAPDYDLAVVRLHRLDMNLPAPIAIGALSDLEVGETVFAIGNPFGLSRTLTKGIISALDRTLPTTSYREIAGVIQTDAAINPGNSGGPLLDTSARLIGVNTAIFSASGSSAGVGFAVPVDIVNRVVPQLIRDGRVPRPGIGIAALDEKLAARLSVEGVVIAGVFPGTPAEKAGLRPLNRRSGNLGDIIVAVEGEPVRTVNELVNLLDRIGVGQQAELTVIRDGARQQVTVTIADVS